MTKLAWQNHIDALVVRPSKGGDREAYRAFMRMHVPGCAECRARAKTRKANAGARIRREVYADLGMHRVVGALGGVYYE